MSRGWMPIALLACTGCIAGGVSPSASNAATTEPTSASCSGVEYRQLDFKIGEFDVTGMEGVRAGESRVESVLSGCMLVEHWRGAISGYGQAVFYYDREQRLWHTTYVSDDGDVLNMSGVFEGDALQFRGEGAVAGFRGLHRMAWSALPAGGVKQFWEYSADSGKTWKTIHIGHYARRP
jgi:hypothetical protein